MYMQQTKKKLSLTKLQKPLNNWVEETNSLQKKIIIKPLVKGKSSEDIIRSTDQLVSITHNKKDSKDWEINLNQDHKSKISVKIVVNFGFFYRGYSKDCYYWEIVMFSRKFLLIFIGVFTEFFPKNAKATIFLVINQLLHVFSNKM